MVSGCIIFKGIRKSFFHWLMAGINVEIFRFYCSSIKGTEVELTGSEAHHLSGVLRLKAGEKVELFDGAGALAEAVVRSAKSRKVVCEIENLQVFERPKTRQIIIASSIAKGERFDWLIGKCTELGVDRIWPVLFERTIKLGKNPRIIERWRNLTISAAKQCGRLFLPVIENPKPVKEVLISLKNDRPKTRVLVGCLDGGAEPLVSKEFTGCDVAGFIGPEGGFTEDEKHFFEDQGAESVRLTDTVLRIETAAVTMAGVLCCQRNADKMQI